MNYAKWWNRLYGGEWIQRHGDLVFTLRCFSYGDMIAFHMVDIGRQELPANWTWMDTGETWTSELH